jgi:hypothetical protein
MERLLSGMAAPTWRTDGRTGARVGLPGRGVRGTGGRAEGSSLGGGPRCVDGLHLLVTVEVAELRRGAWSEVSFWVVTRGGAWRM